MTIVTDWANHQDAIHIRGGMNKTTAKKYAKNRLKRNFVPLKRYRWNPDAIPYMLDKSLGECFKSYEV